MECDIIYIENTAFDWTAPVSDFSTHFLLSKAKLSLVSKRTRAELFDTHLMFWNSPRTSLILGVGESKVCVVKEGKCY